METRRAHAVVPQTSRPRSSATHIPLPLKRRRDGTSSSENFEDMAATECTLGGHLDSPHDLRCVLSNMLSDPQLNSLCDVTLIVQGQRFPAHRAVLAAVSRVFRAMFTNSMKERDADEIVLSSLDARAWRMAMHYIYHAQLDLDDEHTALLLLGTARMYQLERLEIFVENFLVSCVKVSNSFSLLQEAERYDLHELEGACYRKIEEDFESIALSPAFLKCPYQLVLKLIPSGRLVIKSEMFVFESVMRWIEACTEERMEYLGTLLPMVRLSRLSDMELRKAARHTIAQKCPKFKEQAFDRLISNHCDRATEKVLSSCCHLKPRRRDSCVFTFAHMQRGMTKISPADEEEVVRTPWAMDDSGQFLWRLKIYPRGYSKAKGQYLSMYVQGRSACKSEKLDVTAKFDIFLMNRRDHALTISFSSQHHFDEVSDHWGFHRFLQLPQLLNPACGFLDEDTDSVLLGANLYLP